MSRFNAQLIDSLLCKYYREFYVANKDLFKKDIMEYHRTSRKYVDMKLREHISKLEKQME